MRCSLKRYDVIDESVHWEKIERGKRWREKGKEKEGGKEREEER